MKKQILVVCNLIMILTLNANAEFFLKRRAEGWFWYEKKPKVTELKQEEMENAVTPTEKLKAMQEEVEARLHKAILYPTFANLTRYMEMQKAFVDRSQKFANKWQEVIYKTPHLNEEVRYPTSHSAIPVRYQAESMQKQQKIKEIAGEFGLLYFFKSDCPYCQKFAPLIKRFAADYGFEILAISIDGGESSEFSNVSFDQLAAKNLGITTFPTVIAVNERNKKILPITYGFVSYSDLEKSLYFLSEVKDE